MRRRGGILVNLTAVLALLSLLVLVIIQTLELTRYLVIPTLETEQVGER